MNIKEESEEKEIIREDNNKDAEEKPIKKEQKNKLFPSISLRDKIKEMSKFKRRIFVIEKLSKQERKEDLERKKNLREQELEQEENSEVSDNYSSDKHYISNVANNEGLKENIAYPLNIKALSNTAANNNIINTTPLSFNSNNKNIFTVINKKNDNNGKNTSNDLNNMINMSYCTTNLNNNMANKEKESTIKRELWTQEEDNLLIMLLKKYIYENRNTNIGELIQAPSNFHTNPNIKVNIQNIINNNNNSTATPTDLPDEILLNINPNYIDWNSIATEMNTNPTTRKRYGKQLKERYINHLDPRVVKDYWTDNEERILLQKQKEFGNKWNDIARYLPGRTDNAVKNYFYSKLRRLIRYLVKSLIKNNRFKEEKIDENKYDLVFVYKLIKDTKIAFSDINKSRIIETIKDHMNGKIGVKEKSEKRKKRNDSNNNLVSNSNYNNNESFYNNNDNNNRSISNKELHINESSCFSDAKNKPSNNKSKRVKFCYKGENDANANTIKAKKDNCGFTNEGFNISVLNLNDIEEIMLKYNIINDSKVDNNILNKNEDLIPKASQYSVKTEGSCKSGNISKSRNESNASNNSKNNVNNNKYQIVTRRAMNKLSFNNKINDTNTINNLKDISKTESSNNTNNTNVTFSFNNKNNTEISKKNNNLNNKTKKTTPIVYPSLSIILSKNIFLKRKRRRMNKQATSKSQEKQIFMTNSQTQNVNMIGNKNYLVNNDKMLIDQYMKHKQNMPYLNQQQFFSMYNNTNRHMMMNNTNTLGNNLINNNNISSISNNINNIPIIFNIKQENYYINNKRNKNNSNSNVIFNSYKLNKDSMNINNPNSFNTNNGLESCKFEPTNKNLNKKQIDYSLYDKINNNDTNNNNSNSNNSNEGNYTMQIHSPIRSNNILIKDDQTITNNNFSNNQKHSSSNFYYNNNNFNHYYGNYNNATNKSYNNHSNMYNNANNSKQESSAEKNKMPNYNNNNNYNPFNNNSYYNNNINNPFSVTPSNLALNQSFTPTNNENREINYQYRPLISPLNQGGIVFPNGNKFNDSFAISFKSLDFSNLNNASSFNNFVHNAPSFTNSNSNLNLFTASNLNTNKNNETSNSNNINNFNYQNYNKENTNHTVNTGINSNNINSTNSNNINTVNSANNNISSHNISNNNMTSLNSYKSNANNNNDKNSLNNNSNNNTVSHDEAKYTEIPTVATLKNKNFVFNSKDHNASSDYNMFNLSQTENTEYHYTSNYNNNTNYQNDNIKLNVPNSKTSNLSSLGFSYNYNNLNYINHNNKSYNGGVIKPIATMMSNIHTLNNSSNNSNEKNNTSALNPLRENSGDEINLNDNSNKNIPIKTLIKEDPSNTIVNNISNDQVLRNDTENNINDNNSDPNLADKVKLIRPKPKRNFSLSLNIDEINNTDTGAVFINNCINNIENIQTESNQPRINKEAESNMSNSPKITLEN